MKRYSASLSCRMVHLLLWSKTDYTAILFSFSPWKYFKFPSVTQRWGENETCRCSGVSVATSMPESLFLVSLDSFVIRSIANCYESVLLVCVDFLASSRLIQFVLKRLTFLQCIGMKPEILTLCSNSEGNSRPLGANASKTFYPPPWRRLCTPAESNTL